MIRSRHRGRRAALALAAGLLVAHATSAQPERPDLGERLDRVASTLTLDADQRAALATVASRYAEPAPGVLWSAAADVEAILSDAQVDELREAMQAARAGRRGAHQERAGEQRSRRDRGDRQRGRRQDRGDRGLTDAQRADLREIGADLRPRVRDLVASFQAGVVSDEAFVAQARALREEAVSRLQEVLPAEARERMAAHRDRRAAAASARADALGLTAEQREAFGALTLDRIRTAPERPDRQRRARGARPSPEERAQMREQMEARREAARERREEAKAQAHAILTDDQQDVIAVHRALAAGEGGRSRHRRGGPGALGRLLGPIAALDFASDADAGARFGAADVPSALAVEAVVPNPGSDRIRVTYALPEAGAARVEVFDVRGRRVAVLADGARAAGTHEATLDASALSPGVYVVRVVAGGAQAERQLTVAR